VGGGGGGGNERGADSSPSGKWFQASPLLYICPLTLSSALEAPANFTAPTSYSFISQIFLLPIPAFTAVIPAEDSTRSTVICFATVLFLFTDPEQFAANTETDRTTHAHWQIARGVRMLADNHVYRTRILRRNSGAVHLGE